MPQISPIYWLFLMFVIIMIMSYIISMVYFYFKKNFLNQKLNFYSSLNWW